MRCVSKKTAARNAECRDFRRNLVREVGRCELCDDPRRRKRKGDLCVHEIARGCHRSKALDKRFAVLVLCPRCHMQRIHGNETWPETRQLAILRKSRPCDYDLAAYNELVGYGPNRITEEEVVL